MILSVEKIRQFVHVMGLAFHTPKIQRSLLAAVRLPGVETVQVAHQVMADKTAHRVFIRGLGRIVS